MLTQVTSIKRKALRVIGFGQPNCSHGMIMASMGMSHRQTSEISFHLHLIEEVKKYPWLYDLKREDFKDALKTTRTWEQIGALLGKSGAECRRKWKAIRDRFGRLNKEMLYGDRSKADELKKKWLLGERLMFLQEFIQHKHQTVFLGQLQNEISQNEMSMSVGEFDSMIEPIEHVRVEMSSISSSPSSPYYFATPENGNLTSLNVKREPNDTRDDLMLPSASPDKTADNSEESSSDAKNGSVNTPAVSSPSPQSSSVSEALEKLAEENRDRIDQEIECIEGTSMNCAKKDGIGLFMESVAARLRNFDRRKQELVMLKIQQIMFELQDQSTA